ncbi:hypothetical protein NFI96_018312 [Prochilodus magdalenae]|nr:hypothetical protein NFI96_018312 [Prochilodus magdalenae]
MGVSLHHMLRSFEASVSGYVGEDPLDPWDKFVEFLERRLPAEERSSMVVVLERLVQTFLQEKRYHHDPRYISHCISCAGYYSEPIKMYSYVHGRGVGVRAAALYVAWAQQFERKGLLAQAEQVYQRALENQAEPLDMVQQQYRSEHLSVIHHWPAWWPACSSARRAADHVRNPLQNSQLVNQSVRQREAFQSQCKEAESSPVPSDKTVRIVPYAGLKCEVALHPVPSPQLACAHIALLVTLGRYSCGPGLTGQPVLLIVGVPGSGLRPTSSSSTSMFTYVRLFKPSTVYLHPLTLELRDRMNEAKPIRTELICITKPVGLTVKDEERISRSENNPKPGGGSGSSVEYVPMYCVKELECEGSELSFEELRAQRYFTKRRQQELQRNLEEAIWKCEEEEEEVARMKRLLEELNSKLTTDDPQECHRPPAQQELSGAEPCSTRDQLDRSVGPALTPALPEIAATGPVGVSAQLSSSCMGLQPAPERPLLVGRKSESYLLWNSAKVPPSRLSLSLSAASRTAAAAPSDLGMHATTPMRPADQRAASVSQAERSLQESRALKPAAPEQDASEHTGPDGDANPDMSHGAFNHSHLTPNTSLGLITATPSRVLPSPTVNTQEALGVIMDMFQAPTLLQEALFNTTGYAADDSFEKNCRVNSELAPPAVYSFAPPVAKPPPSAPFRIYQDENSENRSEEVEQTRPAARALMEIPVSKPNDTPVGVESLTDESAMWGPRYTSITACPNHTRDFALSAHMVSTPLHPTAPYAWDTELNQENRGFSETEENPYQRQPAKLSPILEQSPPEEKPSAAAECTLRAQGTIVGEGVSLPQQNQTLSQTHNQTSYSVSRNPLAPLALHDHTAEASRGLCSTTKPSWSIYQSPERTSQAEPNSMDLVREPKPDQHNSTGLCVGSISTVKPSWSIYQSPERTSQAGSNGELHSSSMHLGREPKPDQHNSTGLQANSSFATKPSWTIYQSPERTSQAGSNGELHSSSMHLGREPKPDQHNSTGLQANSSFATKPSWSIYQSPERTSQAGSKGELKPDQANSTSMLSVRERCADQPNSSGLQVNSSRALNSSHLHLARELRPDQLNPSSQQPLGVDVCSGPSEADLLQPKRSFHRRKSEKQQNRVIRQENPEFALQSCTLPSSPKPEPRVIQDVPMSPEPAPAFDWLRKDSPVQLEEPDLDIMVRSPQSYSITSGAPAAKSKPTWSVYQSPEKPLEPHVPQSPEPMEESEHHPVSVLEQSGILLSKRSFNRRKSEKRVLEKSLLSSPKPASILIQDIPMSPAPGLNWLCAESPVRGTEPDLDMLMTPQQTSKRSAVVDVPMSPQQGSVPDSAPSVLVSDPWDEDLIASLLSRLKTPLSAYPNVGVWTHNLPSVTPRMTIPMGEESLRVDFVLGQGAFATVYQATHLTTSDRFILKVQKPANPWEFYINSQLNARVQPRARHLFNRLHSAHLFANGSVLVGELHSCGTLLNVVNLYKSRSEKLMPPPLVLYFSVCILQMVEQLHQASIIHADIKPDNFLLGERFLENEDFGAESLDHGLVLIDFGQSVDMTLFPQGTAFTARCMTSGFQCTEMLSGRPWNYQVTRRTCSHPHPTGTPAHIRTRPAHLLASTPDRRTCSHPHPTGTPARIHTDRHTCSHPHPTGTPARVHTRPAHLLASTPDRHTCSRPHPTGTPARVHTRPAHLLASTPDRHTCSRPHPTGAPARVHTRPAHLLASTPDRRTCSRPHPTGAPARVHTRPAHLLASTPDRRTCSRPHRPAHLLASTPDRHTCSPPHPTGTPARLHTRPAHLLASTPDRHTCSRPHPTGTPARVHTRPAHLLASTPDRHTCSRPHPTATTGTPARTDYFGIAGTVYCMIFGSYMQVRNEAGVWKTNGMFKRNPHGDLWQEFFHALLNVPDCNSLPCLRSLRERLSAVLQENYSNKLHSLKNRLVVQILEARGSRR